MGAFWKRYLIVTITFELFDSNPGIAHGLSTGMSLIARHMGKWGSIKAGVKPLIN